MNSRHSLVLRSLLSKNQLICRSCQIRLLHQAPRLRALSQNESQPLQSRPAPNRAIAPTRLREGFKPEPLGAPIGLEIPPDPKHDYLSPPDTPHERHAEYRRLLVKTFAKPYMRDFRNLDAHRGKFYLANSKLWREPASFYFPNLIGQTLAGNTNQDTTRVLQDKISLVAMWSRTWAMEQVKTFTEDTTIRRIIEESGGKAQIVDITWEEQRLYALMMKMFQWNLKKSVSKSQWNKFFVLPGIHLDIKDSIGMANDKVGYVFLVDQNCKIRWSACGDAWDEEKSSLEKSLTRLIAEHRGRTAQR